MKLTRQQVNELIAEKIGLPLDRYCYRWGKRVTKVPDFFGWVGFGMLMEWADDTDNEFHLTTVEFMAEANCGINAKDWPTRFALYMASAFAGEDIELED